MKNEVQLEKDFLMAKVKGDAGTYPVWQIDFLYLQATIYRAGVYETLPLTKVKIYVNLPCQNQK